MISRYDQFDLFDEQLIKSREFANGVVERLGNANKGSVAKLLVEIVRDIAMNTAMQMRADEYPVSPKDLRELTQALSNIEKVSRENEMHELRMELRLKDKENPDDGLLENRRGISPEGIEALRSAIMDEFVNG